MENKIFIFSDLHYGESKNIEGRKLNQPAQSLPNLKIILGKSDINKDNDLVVLLGDLISKNNKEKDIKHINEVLSAVNAAGVKPISVAGNHELNNFNKDEIMQLLGSRRFFDIVLENAELLFLDCMHEGYELFIDDEQLAWLERKVKHSNKPLIIFSHAPLTKYDVKGNVWLESREEKAYIKNWEKVSNILDMAKDIVVCICGHVHHNRFVQNNKVSYITLQSFSENLTPFDEGDACQAYALLEIKEHQLKIVVYNDPSEYIIKM
jgi:Icc protein